MCSLLQAEAYVQAVTNADNNLPADITIRVDGIRIALTNLFDNPSPPYAFNLGKRLASVSNILLALRDLSALHTDSLDSPDPEGSLQALLKNLQK